MAIINCEITSGGVKHRGDDESADDHIRTPFPELGEIDDAGLDQNEHHHRHLEGHAEGNEGGQHEGQVFLDVGHPGDTLGRHGGHEAEDRRKDEKIGKGHADKEEQTLAATSGSASRFSCA
jgi:hypothetical protein